MVILPGDVLFVWGTGFIPEGIERITCGPSHVALFINDTTICEAQGGRPIGETTLSLYLNGSVKRLEVWTDDTLTSTDRAEMIKFAKTMYGEHYDYLLIPLEALHFETGINIDWFHENKHKICSTYVNLIAKHINKVWAKTPDAAPADLYTTGVLKRKVVLK